MAQIYKAIPFAEELFRPFIKSAIQKNHISLDNKYYTILNRFNYFKEKTYYSFMMAIKYEGEIVRHKKTENRIIYVNKNLKKIQKEIIF